MIIKYKGLRDIFHRQGLALTHQRQAVYEALATTKVHPTAESLYQKLRSRHPNLSLATVYKNLRTLERAGLARVVDSPLAQARFDALTRTHHHAICGRCGKIKDVFDASLDRLRPPRGLSGFKALRHCVQFHGLCAACAKKSQRRKKQ